MREVVCIKKLKIYLDTSVISHLQHEDVPEKMQDTLLFWEELKTGKYDVVISDLTFREIRRCPAPKREVLFNYLGEILYEILHETDEVKTLCEAYVENGVLTRKSENDCLHIAFATTSECDVIVSWNFKHLVRLKTIQSVRIVNAKNGYYKPIEIVQPTMMGDGTDENAGN
jgi:predicted nucleic acid-binding protein